MQRIRTGMFQEVWPNDDFMMAGRSSKGFGSTSVCQLEQLNPDQAACEALFLHLIRMQKLYSRGHLCWSYTGVIFEYLKMQHKKIYIIVEDSKSAREN